MKRSDRPTDYIIVEIGPYLKRLRQLRRLTQLEWADKCGVTRMTLWRWESGQSVPREYELQAALAALEVSLPGRRRAFALREEARARHLHVSAAPREQSFVHRGDLLRALRGRRGWTQEQAAQAGGVRRHMLTRWERFEAWPSADRIHALAYALGARENELLALTNGLAELWPSLQGDDIETARAYADAVSKNVPLPFMAAEPVALAQMHRLAKPAKRIPQAASLLRFWHLFYANRLVGVGRFAEARLYLRRSTQLPPDEEPNRHFNYLQILLSFLSAALRSPMRLRREAASLLSEQREAFSRLEDKALSLNDHSRVMHQGRVLQEMAVSLSWLGQDEQALVLSAQSLSIARRLGDVSAVSLLYERCNILCRAGRYDLILEEFPRFLGVYPVADAHLHLGLGKACEGVGDDEGAMKHLTLAGSLARQFHRERIEREASEALRKLTSGTE